MKIANNVFLAIPNNKKIVNNSIKQDPSLSGADSVSQGEIKYSRVSFGAMHPNFKKKKLNIEEEKNKLIRKLDEYLKTEADEKFDAEEAVLSAVVSVLNMYRKREERLQKISDEITRVLENNTMNLQSKNDALRVLCKEYKQVESFKIKKPPQKQKPKLDEKIDLNLLNKMKSSILEDDFELKKVYDNYYSGLNDISTVEELKEKYPKIKVPLRPENVIAKKIEESFSRSFYEQFDKLVEDEKEEELMKLVNEKILDTAVYICEKYGLPLNETFFKLSDPTYEYMTKHYEQILKNGSFSKVPMERKDKIPKISDNEAKLLSVDFDKFVLSVVRQQYLYGQKINNITYEENGTKIQAGMLKEPEYKFEKPSEKIKKIITDAAAIHFAQRDYQNFNVDELKARLDYFASNNAGKDEDILERIIEFDSCSFTNEDIPKLIMFLGELDCLEDGKKTTDEVLATLEKDSIYPIGTQKLNEIERQEAARKFHEEQQKRTALKNLKNTFDDAVNILYSNDLNGIANICFKYRPSSLDKNAVEAAEFIINTIKESEKKHQIKNKQVLENNIIRWDTFKYYESQNSMNPIFEEAVEYGTDGDDFSQQKAGQYIINAEIVKNYPESLQFVKNPDVLSKVMEKSGENLKQAAIALCKYNDYCDADESVKNSINKFSQLFDENDPAQKSLLRYVVENEYIQQDTAVKAKIRDNSDEFVNAVFSSSAKKAIFDKYKYPLCMEFLTGFEDAMSNFAGQKGDSGIKKIETNNKALQYKMEVKLMGHDDRLFSSSNDYCFDIYSSKGLH